MSNRLEEIKDEVAQEYGYDSFEDFDDKSTFRYNQDTPDIITKIALKYAREVESGKAKIEAKFPKEVGSKKVIESLFDDQILML
jgi:hypothetical protein